MTIITKLEQNIETTAEEIFNFQNRKPSTREFILWIVQSVWIDIKRYLIKSYQHSYFHRNIVNNTLQRSHIPHPKKERPFKLKKLD